MEVYDTVEVTSDWPKYYDFKRTGLHTVLNTLSVDATQRSTCIQTILAEI